MKNYLRNSTLAILCFVGFTFANNEIVGIDANNVSHKNLQLDLYLDLIRYNTQEKIGILPYILKNNKGVYLEIGTGGDPISEMFSQIPGTSQVTVIASDVEAGVLEALPRRHPQLQTYLNAKEGPKLEFLKLDATDMSVFNDGFLSGINASSVVHEIISYAGGFDGMEKFFREAIRTLQLGGVLVYRDPEGVDNKNESISISLKNKNIRLFAHVFLYKFLDSRGSILAKSGRKFCLYKPDEVRFIFYKKNDTQQSSLSYEEYLKVPSYDIDFSRKYVIKLPCGLYRELARHYLTYLHQCNPLVFVKYTPNIFSEKYAINYFAHSTSTILANFLVQNSIELEGGMLNSEDKIKIDNYIEKRMQVLEFGVPLHFSSKAMGHKLRDILESNNFSASNYIITLNDEDCLLDYRIFGLLYDALKVNIFDEFNYIIEKKDEEHAKWLKREGEESYCYLSVDELITNVLKITQTESVNNKGNKELFVLCPISAESNKFIERICYSEILNNMIDAQDSFEYEINVIDGKRVIHFAKMTLSDALYVCKNIIQQNPMKYKKLCAYIKSLETA